jgi:hypothetical protein
MELTSTFLKRICLVFLCRTTLSGAVRLWDRPENWLAIGDGWRANEIVGAISPENLVEGNVFATADEVSS